MRTLAEAPVDRAGEDVEQQVEIRPARQLSALPRELEQPPGRGAVHLPQGAAHPVDLGIAALGDQGADDAATGGGRAQGGRAHEQGVQIGLEPARFGRLRRPGELVDFRSDDRYRAAADGRLEQTPWSTPLGAARLFGPVRLASTGEGRWHTPTGDHAYIELTIDDVRYNVPG